MAETFIKRSRIEAPAQEVFAWHASPDALQKLMPPWEKSEIIEAAPGIHDGARGVLLVRIGPFRVRWEFEHKGYEEGRQFQDFQRRGPFRRWEHRHRFLSDGPHASWLEDRVEYELPFGALGRILGRKLVWRRLERTFAYRHKITAEAFAQHSRNG